VPKIFHFISSLNLRTGRTDLEHCLRPYCQRLIVKGTPLSGAHLLFPKERVAIRSYYQCDIEPFQKQEARENEEKQQRKQGQSNQEGISYCQTTKKSSGRMSQQKKSTTTTTKTVVEKDIVNENDFDNMCSFLKAFETAIVLFILDNPHDQTRQLNDMNSHLHKTERLVQYVSNNFKVRCL
jgi:hypothetical protein